MRFFSEQGQAFGKMETYVVTFSALNRSSVLLNDSTWFYGGKKTLPNKKHIQDSA